MNRNPLNRPFVRFLVGGISLLAVISLSRSVYSLWRKRDYVKERAQALVQEQVENARLKKAIEEAQKPEFIEKEAREKLGMTKEGETIVILPRTQNAESNPPAGEAGDQKKTEEISNWKKWWGLFF